MPNEVVITGLGIVCPLGVGGDDVWAAVERRQSGVRPIPRLADTPLKARIGGEVLDLDPKQYVKPRKSLKVMCRETHLGFSAAAIAWEDAGLAEGAVPPERLGVVFGANIFRSELEELAPAYQENCRGGDFDLSAWGERGMPELYPLWMLKYLPNMTACHIGIYFDARGPINTIVEGDVSALLAIIEGAEVIARGHADVVVVGATSSMLSPVDVCWHAGCGLSSRVDDPAGACRPFDAQRDGTVVAEGAGAFVLESRDHAERRAARVLARVRGHGRRAEPAAISLRPTGQAVRNSIAAALQSSGLEPADIGHVNAHGLGSVEEDPVEACAIRDVLGSVPVTAPKSFFGNIGAAGGAVELGVSLLGLSRGVVPPTLNHETPDPACPLEVVTELAEARSNTVIALNQKLTGQAVALLVESEG